MAALSPGLSRSYDAWHDSVDTSGAEEAPWYGLVESHLGDLAGAEVLEVACGRGGLASRLAARGPARLVAADFSWAAVSRASTRSGVPVVQADVARLPHRDGAFSLVVSCETVEHVPDPARAVRELARVLAPGGRLLLTTPNYLNLMGLYRGYRRLAGRPFTEAGQPLNHLTLLPRTLSWLRAAGLRPRLVDACGYYVPFPGRRPVRVRALDAAPAPLSWLASHQLVVSTRDRR